jgi:hypothetical protein
MDSTNDVVTNVTQNIRELNINDSNNSRKIDSTTTLCSSSPRNSVSNSSERQKPFGKIGIKSDPLKNAGKNLGASKASTNLSKPSTWTSFGKKMAGHGGSLGQIGSIGSSLRRHEKPAQHVTSDEISVPEPAKMMLGRESGPSSATISRHVDQLPSFNEITSQGLQAPGSAPQGRASTSSLTSKKRATSDLRQPSPVPNPLGPTSSFLGRSGRSSSSTIVAETLQKVGQTLSDLFHGGAARSSSKSRSGSGAPVDANSRGGSWMTFGRKKQRHSFDVIEKSNKQSDPEEILDEVVPVKEEGAASHTHADPTFTNITYPSTSSVFATTNQTTHPKPLSESLSGLPEKKPTILSHELKHTDVKMSGARENIPKPVPNVSNTNKTPPNVSEVASKPVPKNKEEEERIRRQAELANIMSGKAPLSHKFTDHYELGEVLGEGAFGFVITALRRIDGKEVSIAQKFSIGFRKKLELTFAIPGRR